MFPRRFSAQLCCELKRSQLSTMKLLLSSDGELLLIARLLSSKSFNTCRVLGAARDHWSR